MKAKIRKGDIVIVITGEDKGKRGEVVKVLPEEGKLVVQGVNIAKKHQKQVQQQGRTLRPGIVELEMPIDISNVMLEDPNGNKPTRIRIEYDSDGVPHRVGKRTGKKID